MEFNEIYEKFSARVFRLCVSYVNNTEKAKDLTQETFISVWLNLHNFRQESTLGTWIYRIACNKCIRELENDARFQTKELSSITCTTQDSNNQVEKIQFLRNCLAELPELDRMLMGLYLENLDQEQIADIIGISHANVRVRIHRIKKKLAQKWNEYE